MHCQAWMLGSCRSMQCRKTWLDERPRWMSQRWRCLHRLHDAGFSRQIHVLYGPAAGIAAIVARGCDVWKSNTGITKVYTVFYEQRTGLAQTQRGTDNRT